MEEYLLALADGKLWNQDSQNLKFPWWTQEILTISRRRVVWYYYYCNWGYSMIGACINSSQPLRKILWKEHEVLAIFVPLSPCYPKSPMSFLLQVFHNLLEAFVFLKIAEPNVEKPLDESNEINTDNLIPFHGLLGLHLWEYWAPLVVSSTGMSSKVKSSNTNVTLLGATKYQVFFPLFVHGLTKAFLENSLLIFSQHRASVLISELEIIMWRFLLISS